MSLTSYRAAPPRVKSVPAFHAALAGSCEASAGKCRAEKRYCKAPAIDIYCWGRRREDDRMLVLGRPGSDLLSRVLRRSTIGAGVFHGRVRNGIGCSHPAKTTRSAKHKHLRSWICSHGMRREHEQ